MPLLEPYRKTAPFSAKELLEAVNTLLRAKPQLAIAERTLRYYITTGLAASPEGPPRFARYSFRHLAALLYIRLMQDQGVSLDKIRADLDPYWRASPDDDGEEAKLLATLEGMLDRAGVSGESDLGYQRPTQQPLAAAEKKLIYSSDDPESLASAIASLTSAIQELREEVKRLSEQVAAQSSPPPASSEDPQD